MPQIQLDTFLLRRLHRGPSATISLPSICKKKNPYGTTFGTTRNIYARKHTHTRDTHTHTIFCTSDETLVRYSNQITPTHVPIAHHAIHEMKIANL